MAILPGGQFDPSQHKDMRDFTPMPPGKYVVKITDSISKPTSAGGEMLNLTMSVVAGPYIGKAVIARLNLVNSSPKAVIIAQEELATMLRACGLGPITQSEQMHNIAFIVNVKLVPGVGQYPPKNEPIGYSSASGMTEPPVNPEPDAQMMAIINGMAPIEGAPAAAPAVAPAGFAAPPPAADPAAPPAPPVAAPPAPPPPAPPVAAPPVAAPPVAEAGNVPTVPAVPPTPTATAEPASVPVIPPAAAPPTAASPSNPPVAGAPPPW